MTEDRNGSFGKALLAFTVGAAIGGGLVLLTAPRSGADTRRRMRGMVDDTNDRLHEITEEAENRIKQAVQEGRDLLDEKSDMIKAAIKAGKAAMEAEKGKHGQAS